MNPEPYRHSGQAPIAGLMLAMLVTIMGAIPLGIAYAFLLVWIPIVQLNLLATAGLGGAIGGVAGMCARFGKVRNGAIVPFFSLIGATAALWAAWVFDAKARFGAADMPLLLNPILLVQYVSEFYTNGFWTMGKNDQPVSGIFLLICWLAEAGAVLVTSFLVSRGIVGALPFCETCDQWTKRVEAFCRFRCPAEDTVVMQQIKDGDLSELFDLETCLGDKDRSLKLDVWRCPTCEDSSYVTINNVRLVKNKKGEVTTQLMPLVTFGQLTPEEMQELQSIRDSVIADES